MSSSSSSSSSSYSSSSLNVNDSRRKQIIHHNGERMTMIGFAWIKRIRRIQMQPSKRDAKCANDESAARLDNLVRLTETNWHCNTILVRNQTPLFPSTRLTSPTSAGVQYIAAAAATRGVFSRSTPSIPGLDALKDKKPNTDRRRVN